MARKEEAEAPTATGKVLPPGAGRWFRHRVMELFGSGLFIFGGVLLAVCLTYSATDPSLNRATDQPVSNILGLPGAYAADVFMQTLGLAAFLVPLILFGWVWRLVTHRGITQFWLRLAALPVALFLAALACQALPTPDSWPVSIGMGGIAGHLFLEKVQGLGGLGPVLGALVAAALALPALAYASAITWREWRGLGGFFSHLVTGVRRRREARKTEPAVVDEPRLERPVDDEGGRREPTLGPPKDSWEEPETEAPVPGLSNGLVVEAPAPTPDLAPEVEAPKRKSKRGEQRSLDLRRRGDYVIPPLDLLTQPSGSVSDSEQTRDALEKNARLLETVLDDFGVKGQIVKVRPGPVVTRYELEPAPGTKTSRVVGLADDIARSMSAVSVRVAVVPGSNVIGIELPNAKREKVLLGELIASKAYSASEARLPLVLGKDIGGQPQIVDLSRMPHLLVAGTTGSGKSVAINAMILSLLYRLQPEQCRLIMVDPKMLELSVYDGIPHLLTPVVTDPKKAIVALKWAVREMETRYRLMSQLGVRNIEGYNSRIEEARKGGETLLRRVQTGFDPETGQPVFEQQPIDLTAIPFIVVVVDEMADLMLVAGKEIEGAVQRLAQMARAAGIHLIMATQRPSVDVITGTIKANFPTRISFHVTSKIDSRTILGEQGAEQLLGQGDMLYMAGGGRIARVHGPLVTDHEVEEIVAHLKSQGAPAYIEQITEEPENNAAAEGGEDEAADELYSAALEIVRTHGKASTSFVQRHLQIGYNRAARLVERMEAEGVVSPANHVGKREVLGRS